MGIREREDMRALCFDQSTTATGWAYGDEHADPRPGSNSPFHSGVIKIPKRDEFGERLAFLHRAAEDLIDKFQPEIIGYEEPYFPHQGAGGGKPKERYKGRSGFISPEMEAEEGDAEEAGKSRFNPDMLKKLQMVKGVIITLAALYSIPVAPCTPSQWRVTFLGYGRRPKGEADDFMKHAARRRARSLGHEATSFDECDAIGIHYHTLHGKQALGRMQGDLLGQIAGNL